MSPAPRRRRAGAALPGRAVAVLVAVAVGATACGGGEPAAPVSPSVDSRAVVLARVTDAVTEVAQAQTATDPELATALTGAHEVDVMVAGLRDPEAVDATKDTWPRVEAAVSAVDLEPLRPAIREMAFAVDRARLALARASEAVDDAWETRYLAAQDATLVAMRAYAEEADALAQVLERHWPTYQDIAELTGAFVERRWVYRSSEEAAAAYEVEITRHLPALRSAQEEIARFRDRRDDAAIAVNEASNAAAAVFRERPRPTPTPSPTRSP